VLVLSIPVDAERELLSVLILPKFSKTLPRPSDILEKVSCFYHLSLGWLFFPLLDQYVLNFILQLTHLWKFLTIFFFAISQLYVELQLGFNLPGFVSVHQNSAFILPTHCQSLFPALVCSFLTCSLKNSLLGQLGLLLKFLIFLCSRVVCSKLALF